MPHLRPGHMPHVALERLAQGQARNRDIAELIDRDSVSVRELLNKLIGQGLVVMAKRRLGRGNPFAIYEITEIGRGELERLGAARRVWRGAA
jgi:predicted ArsR family transcriptional regulator